jgi:single-strand DNA-binding protein
MDNQVTLIGNLTRDPEIKYTQGGQARCNFSIAVNRRWQNRQTQEWEEAVGFFNVVCWRDIAEHVAESLAKGARVIVTGRLDQRSWETDTNEKRSVVEVNADDVGPSLKYATAEVVRTERTGSLGGGGFQGGGQPGPARQPGPADGGGGNYRDDEPF